MSGLNLEKHFSLTSSKLIQQICDPVLNLIGITYFNYIKIYHNENNDDYLNVISKGIINVTNEVIDLLAKTQPSLGLRVILK